MNARTHQDRGALQVKEGRQDAGVLLGLSQAILETEKGHQDAGVLLELSLAMLQAVQLVKNVRKDQVPMGKENAQ